MRTNAHTLKTTAGLMICLCVAGLGRAEAQSYASSVSTSGSEQLAATSGLDATNQNGQAPLAFRLKPTAIAPAGSGGTAEIKGHSLAVHLSQLSAGQYELRIFRGKDGTAKKVGTVTIVDSTQSPSRQATDNKKEASANQSTRVETDMSVRLPEPVIPGEIKRIQLLGAGGNAVLDSSAK